MTLRRMISIGVVAALGLPLACNSNGAGKVAMDDDGVRPRQASVIEAPDSSQCDGRPIEVIEKKGPTGIVEATQEVIRLDDGTTINHGLYKTFWEQGQPKLEMTFVCGARHGLKLAWHPDGSRWQQGAYFNQRDNGTWKEWRSDGTLVRRWTMEYGSWNGVYTEWYASGEKHLEVEWVRGKKQGPQLLWDEFGVLRLRVDMVDNVPQPTPAPAL